jgi:hypothetical protein
LAWQSRFQELRIVLHKRTNINSFSGSRLMFTFGLLNQIDQTISL